MTAHDRFSRFVGEIGIPRLEYLYDLSFCDIVLIERGYERRKRDIWSSARWSTYHVMTASVGSKGMADSGIYAPIDLIKFPWEKESVVISNEERDELIAEMAAYNGKPRQ